MLVHNQTVGNGGDWSDGHRPKTDFSQFSSPYSTPINLDVINNRYTIHVSTVDHDNLFRNTKIALPSNTDKLILELSQTKTLEFDLNLYNNMYRLADAFGIVPLKSPIPVLYPGDVWYMPERGVPNPPGREIPKKIKDALHIPENIQLFINPDPNNPGAGIRGWRK